MEDYNMQYEKEMNEEPELQIEDIEEAKNEDVKLELLESVESANTNPDGLNDEGKINLATEIIEKMAEKELNQFLKGYGYEK